MAIFESNADRRIAAARKAGLFDNLPGAGKPIPDLDRQRPEGWWATRLVKRERSIIKAETLDRQVKAAMPRLWRLGSEAEVREQVEQLNKRIDAYNQTTTWKPYSRLDASSVVTRWMRVRRLLGGPPT
ncbi:MAG: DUF1992 domain-containing protein [Actinobacteria bacterium]|nr:DUF1992 domain-containing protein [Actinomycetota bacterium]